MVDAQVICTVIEHQSSPGGLPLELVISVEELQGSLRRGSAKLVGLTVTGRLTTATSMGDGERAFTTRHESVA